MMSGLKGRRRDRSFNHPLDILVIFAANLTLTQSLLTSSSDLSTISKDVKANLNCINYSVFMHALVEKLH